MVWDLLPNGFLRVETCHDCHDSYPQGQRKHDRFFVIIMFTKLMNRHKMLKTSVQTASSSFLVVLSRVNLLCSCRSCLYRCWCHLECSFLPVHHDDDDDDDDDDEALLTTSWTVGHDIVRYDYHHVNGFSQRRQEEQREKFCRVVAATPVTWGKHLWVHRTAEIFTTSAKRPASKMAIWKELASFQFFPNQFTPWHFSNCKNMRLVEVIVHKPPVDLNNVLLMVQKSGEKTSWGW